VRSLLLFITTLIIAACGGPSRVGGPCGGGQFAQAHAILPDTGINAGDTLSVGFLQHDTNELSELVIWHLWPFGTGAIDPEPDPRVRIVHDDGRVLLDSVGSRYSQPENQYNRPTWFVFTWVHEAGLRNAFYEGFQDEALWIELWHLAPPGLGTRVRLTTDTIGVHARATCL
jgi:hypothetical protein